MRTDRNTISLEVEVKRFVAEWTGLPANKITNDRSFFNLGIDGEDAVEFMREFSDRFDVDLSSFIFDDHFGSEGLSISSLYYWPEKLLKKIISSVWNWPVNKCDLRVSSLVKSAELKYWPQEQFGDKEKRSGTH